MSKFKVGDRVRILRAKADCANVEYGQEGIVEGPDGMHGVVLAVPGVDRKWFISDRNLELVEPLKLVKGATVTIGDGKDEWEVTYVNRIEADLKRGLARCVCGVVSLTVVKAKPQPPKPVDYYVNCKGAEPKDGDVFLAAGRVAGIADGFYQFLWGSRPHSLTDPIKAHSIGKEYYPRTLLARDNQPYTGNV